MRLHLQEERGRSVDGGQGEATHFITLPRASPPALLGEEGRQEAEQGGSERGARWPEFES